MILNRLRLILDPLQRNSRNGLHPELEEWLPPGLNNRWVDTGAEEDTGRRKRAEPVITIIDFNTIHQGKLMNILRDYGVPEKMV